MRIHDTYHNVNVKNEKETKIKVSDLVENYKDNGDGGVFGYNDRLTIRPSFQRKFIYGEKQRVAVIDSVMNGFPLNIMYWSKTWADTYEVLNGQQHTISIAQYIMDDEMFTHNPIKDEGFTAQNLATNYPLSALGSYNYLIYLREMPGKALADLKTGLPTKCCR